MRTPYRTWGGLRGALAGKLQRAVLKRFRNLVMDVRLEGSKMRVLFADDSEVVYAFKADIKDSSMDVWLEWDAFKPNGARRDSGTVSIVSGSNEYPRWISAAIAQLKPIVRTVTASRAREAYSYGCLLARFPDPVRSRMIKMAKEIPERFIFNGDDDGELGREDKPHVTVKYGIHTDDAEKVRETLKGWAPVKVKVGTPSVFEADDYIVLKLSMEGEELHQLNKQICDELECTDTFPDYQPHATIAYLVKDKDNPKYYEKLYDDSLTGSEMVLDELQFSTADGKKTVINLVGTPETQMASELLRMARGMAG